MPKSRPSAASPRGSSSAVARIDEACRRAVLGKLAVRDIAGWVAAFAISESEFRVLWRLHAADGAECSKRPADDLDQAALAAHLAVSPAQVSTVVDRLRHAGHIAAAPADDRRRQVWRLTPSGRELLQNIVAAVAAASSTNRGKEAA
jgi:DNA-binding MarR family transcriptional regulator